jgi:transposase
VIWSSPSSTPLRRTSRASLKGRAKLGKSKDHRPDHLQLVVGVVMRRDGLPVACEIWPGNWCCPDFSDTS